MSMKRLFPISITVSQIFFYSYGTGMVTNVIYSQVKESSPKIAMHVDVILEFVWISWYEVYRSIFPIKMYFNGYLICVDSDMWRICRSQSHISMCGGCP